MAADYYRAMSQIEDRLHSLRPAPRSQPDAGYLLALADALCSGTLNDAQRETLHALRAGIMALAPVAQPREAATEDSMPPAQRKRPAREAEPPVETDGPLVLGFR